MSKKLAIKSHITRGKEVIELLKMMGGCESGYCGGGMGFYYYISQFGNIEGSCEPHEFDTYIVYTLEEFLEKYPFKVGDKIIDKADGCPGVVCEMKWDEDVSDMKYCVAFGNGIDFGWFANDSIEFCKENENLGETPVRDRDDILFDSTIWHLRNSVNNGKQHLSGGKCEEYFREVVKKNNENKMKNVLAELLEHIKTTSKEELEKEFNELEEWSHVGPTVEEFMTFCGCVNKKPVYPKTIEECVKLLGVDFRLDMDSYKRKLMANFYRLILCRDAYWKMAGEEMGLEKTWQPDWEYEAQVKYMITTFNNELEFFSSIHSYVVGRRNHILSFPTEEMRDVFYENFKDLIEECKELL